jgi:hypothetical protein
MSILESVLNYKAKKDAEQAQAANAIPQAVAAFISGRQQQVENQQKDTMLKIQAANAGYTLGADGSLIADPNSDKNIIKQLQAQSLISGIQLKNAQLGMYGGVNGQGISPNDPTVQAIIQGRTDINSLPRQSRQAYLDAANQIDPTLDTNVAKARAGMRKDFTSGKYSQMINAANTAIGHMGTLADKFQALGNTDIPLVNAGKNALSEAIGNPQVTGARTVVTALSSELQRVYRQVGAGSVEEIKQWEKNFPFNGSPKQQKEALDTAAELLASKTNTSQDQWNSVMGIPMDVPFLNDKAKGTLQKLGVADKFQFGEGASSKSNEFATPAEADAAGLPAGTIVLVGGRKYKI